MKKKKVQLNWSDNRERGERVKKKKEEKNHVLEKYFVTWSIIDTVPAIVKWDYFVPFWQLSVLTSK